MSPTREAVVVTDLVFGDSTKGSVVDYLARTRNVHTVVRHHGGAQAAHNVVTPDGSHHTFAQFGSGTFVPGVRTYLSRFMVVHPTAMVVEERYLRKAGISDAFARTFISRDAFVITPFHQAANRLRELARGDKRHGSCGVGMGETVADALKNPDDAIRVSHLFAKKEKLMKRLSRIQERMRNAVRDEMRICKFQSLAKDDLWLLDYPDMTGVNFHQLEEFIAKALAVDEEYLKQILQQEGTVVFEGAHGVLLDEIHGFHPYTTWSNCTPENALALLAEHGFDGSVEKLGLMRAYATRHGPGPFVTWDKELSERLPDDQNEMGMWQREFRVGWFDAVAVRYAIAASDNQIDSLVVSCLDRLECEPYWKICTAYELPDDLVDSQEIDLFFERFPHDNKLVRNIKLGPRGNLRHQARLTELMMQVKPVYIDTAVGTLHATSLNESDERVRAHIQKIQAELGLPVSLLSFGPQAQHKRTIL
ncbi:MAG: adenylosuccinate synthetase [Patescibacteria group bacterium]